MAKLTDLLRYKKRVTITHPEDENKKLATVWIKLLGDEDTQIALRAARIASAARRTELNDKDSAAHKDAALQLREQSREIQEQLILSSKENQFVNQAPAIVDREDLPDIDSIARIPDAPTLEEQEKLDSEIDKVNDKYRKALQAYIDDRLEEEKAIIKELSDEEVYELAYKELANIQPLQTFVAEVSAQRGYLGTWDDEACKVRSFESIEDFKNAHEHIKNIILTEYDKLDMGPEDLKN